MPATTACPTPSRYDNPFATCWTRPGAIKFHFATGQSAEQLVMRLAAQGWFGAIVGPHGSGKSTLLETLKPALRLAGRRAHTITLRDRQRRLPEGFAALGPQRTILLVDGYEQLPWHERWRLVRRCRSTSTGLLVTSHVATNVPLLIQLAPDRQLVQQLVADLTAQVSTSIASADVAASHACHGSNVREIFFDLYDLHERLRRS